MNPLTPMYNGSLKNRLLVKIQIYKNEIDSESKIESQ